MFLSLLAAGLHAAGYTIYLVQVYGGGSVPNPSSWSVWAFLTILNALSFWRASKDALATTQFFTGSVMCFMVWMYSLFGGRFSPLDRTGEVVLISCIIACLIWWATQKAIYANLVVAGILLFSSLPTIQGVWQNSGVERALPWYLWTAAFVVTAVNVARRHRGKPRWWLLMVLPITGIVIHGVVAIAAK